MQLSSYLCKTFGAGGCVCVCKDSWRGGDTDTASSPLRGTSVGALWDARRAARAQDGRETFSPSAVKPVCGGGGGPRKKETSHLPLVAGWECARSRLGSFLLSLPPPSGSLHRLPPVRLPACLLARSPSLLSSLSPPPSPVPRSRVGCRDRWPLWLMSAMFAMAQGADRATPARI